MAAAGAVEAPGGIGRGAASRRWPPWTPSSFVDVVAGEAGDLVGTEWVLGELAAVSFSSKQEAAT
jgi:hypothetical protein